VRRPIPDRLRLIRTHLSPGLARFFPPFRPLPGQGVAVDRSAEGCPGTDRAAPQPQSRHQRLRGRLLCGWFAMRLPAKTRAARPDKEKPANLLSGGISHRCGGRIWTCDLQVMRLKPTRCISHSTGNPFRISGCSCMVGGWRPSRIASTISGASSVSRRTWPT
jgi:hypothetical protein